MRLRQPALVTTTGRVRPRQPAAPGDQRAHSRASACGVPNGRWRPKEDHDGWPSGVPSAWPDPALTRWPHRSVAARPARPRRQRWSWGVEPRMRCPPRSTESNPAVSEVTDCLMLGAVCLAPPTPRGRAGRASSGLDYTRCSTESRRLGRSSARSAAPTDHERPVELPAGRSDTPL